MSINGGKHFVGVSSGGIWSLLVSTQTIERQKWKEVEDELFGWKKVKVDDDDDGKNFCQITKFVFQNGENLVF